MSCHKISLYLFYSQRVSTPLKWGHVYSRDPDPPHRRQNLSIRSPSREPQSWPQGAAKDASQPRGKLSIPKAQWAKLVEIIKARLAGNEFLFAPAAELVAVAEAIVQKLRSCVLVQPTGEALDGDTAHVQLGNAEMENGRSVGCERLALTSLDALGLPGVLKDVGLSDRDARIAMALVIAHMIHPSS